MGERTQLPSVVHGPSTVKCAGGGDGGGGEGGGAGGGEGGGAGGGEREGEAPEPMAKDSSGSSGHDSGRVPVAEDGGDTSAASAEPASSAGGADGCASSSGGFPVVDEKLMRRLAEQSDKLDTGYSAIENCGSQAPRRSYNLRNFDPKLVESLEAARQRVGEGESVEPELTEAVAQVLPQPQP